MVSVPVLTSDVLKVVVSSADDIFFRWVDFKFTFIDFPAHLYYEQKKNVII